MDEDRRQSLRYSVTGRAQLQLVNSTRALIVRLVDISEIGVCFLSDDAVPMNAKGRLSFKLLGDSKFYEAAPIVQVTTCVLERRMYRLGTKFVDTDPETSKVLHELIQARSRVVQGH
jgi:hypothetical protein